MSRVVNFQPISSGVDLKKYTSYSKSSNSVVISTANVYTDIISINGEGYLTSFGCMSFEEVGVDLSYQIYVDDVLIFACKNLAGTESISGILSREDITPYNRSSYGLMLQSYATYPLSTLSDILDITEIPKCCVINQPIFFKKLVIKVKGATVGGKANCYRFRGGIKSV